MNVNFSDIQPQVNTSVQSQPNKQDDLDLAFSNLNLLLDR